MAKAQEAGMSTMLYGTPGNGGNAFQVVPVASPSDNLGQQEWRMYVAWLRLFVAPDQVTELRALKVKPKYGRPATYSGYFDGEHLEDMVQNALRLSERARGVYFVPNAINQALLSRRCNRVDVAGDDELTKDEHIERRRFLLLDIDPRRPAGISANEDERTYAAEIGRQIAAHLTQHGFPLPIVGDSGNGAHILYRIDLPPDDDGIIKRILHYLAARFDDERAIVDCSVFNPARIWKVYGSIARKGDSTPERPHRRARITQVPASLDVVPTELLNYVGGQAPPEVSSSRTATHATIGRSRNRQEAAIQDRALAYLAKLPPSIEGQNGSGRAFHAACVLIRGFAFSVVEALPIFMKWNETHAQPPWSEQELLHKLQDADKKDGERGYLLDGKHISRKANPRKLDHVTNEAVGPNRRPEVGDAWEHPADRLTQSPSVEMKHNLKRHLPASDIDLAVVTSQVWEILKADNDPPTLFRYGTIPARIESDDDGDPLIRAMTVDRMRHRLARHATWYRVTKNGDKVPSPPPLEVVRDVLASPDAPLPILTRIVQAPVFAADGTLHIAPGYNAKSRTYLATADGFVVPAVSNSPSQAEIKEAVDLLTVELIGDFPFVGDSEKAHSIAALLAPFARDLIPGPTPLHSFEAPCPGTGKTLLIDAITLPALGKSVNAMSEARDDDEWRKRVFAKLRLAPTVVFIDNVHRRVDSAALASVLTAFPQWDDRLLGKSEIVTVPVRCTWILSANNPAFSSEMSRRTIRIRLDAKADQPWLRTGFRHPDLIAWAKEHRARLVWAALTLIQAWLAAGRQPGRQTLGMYESWAKTIGGILDTAGIPGFLANLQQFYEIADAEGATWRAFVAAWWNERRNEEVKAADLFALAVDAGMALGEKSEQSQKVRLGQKIAEARDRVFAIDIGEPEKANLRIEKVGVSRRATLWQLVSV